MGLALAAMTVGQGLERVYRQRFSDRDARVKYLVWREITRYLQRFVDPESRVLDVACDRGDFICNIEAGEKWATDVRDVSFYLPEGIRFVRADALALDRELPKDYFGAIFISNYLEHLASSELVIRQLTVANKLLQQGGRLIVLQPNIRLVGHAYWDFIDHQTALTERSLREAAELAGFETSALITRFLPYTTKSWLPKHPLLVRSYLLCRPAWLLAGKQSLYVGEKPRGAPAA